MRTCGFAQDITESKRNEQLERDKQALEQLSRAKTQFLSYMSHELRTPLNAIVGFSQLLQSRADALPPTVARYPDLILQASEHLLRLINDLLDLSLVESGGLALSRDRVDVPKLLHELIVLLDPIARKRDVEVRMEPGARMHCSVWGDSTRLRQSFINLLSNGIKYNRHGGTLTVRVLPGEGQVRIEFEDQGDGIPADKLDSLFEPLQRLGRESGDVEGAGLGLALTRSLIERMGGRIGVRSQVGRGSVFVVEMPRAEEDDGPVSRPAPWIEPEALAAPRPYGRVLCIEDNEFNCLLLEGLFEQRPGLAVSYARTGAEGLLLAQQSPPDLILLDMRLPDMDGHQVYAQLQQDARTRGVPVIACSASAYAEDIRQALSEGLAGYLIKPLNMPQFLATIDRFLPPPVEGR